MAYHLVLSILISKKEDEEPQPHIFKAKVVCDMHIQMQGIQYVFIDKISMVTCHELYAINSHLGQVQKIHDKLVMPFTAMKFPKSKTSNTLKNHKQAQ